MDEYLGSSRETCYTDATFGSKSNDEIRAMSSLSPNGMNLLLYVIWGFALDDVI